MRVNSKATVETKVQILEETTEAFGDEGDEEQKEDD